MAIVFYLTIGFAGMGRPPTVNWHQIPFLKVIVKNPG
jgi:hypothetical protein